LADIVNKKKDRKTNDRLFTFLFNFSWFVIFLDGCASFILSMMFVYLILFPNPNEFWIFFPLENLVGKFILSIIFFTLACYGIKISLEVRRFFKNLVVR